MILDEYKKYNAEYYPVSVLTWLNEATERVFDDFESRLCPSCRWFQQMGEDENDLCNNTSGSSHPIQFAAADFGCNRWESQK